MNKHVTTDSQPLRNITPFDELVLEIEDLFAEATNWADGSPVENQAQCDALDVLDKALLDAGASVRLTDRQGQTPLQLARARGYKDMVKMLETAGAK